MEKSEATSNGVEHYEFFHPQYHSVLGVSDKEGRLLGEGNAPRELMSHESIDWLPAHYSDSRNEHPKPMNRSALRQVTKHWNELLALVSSMRREFVERYRIEGNLTGSELWRFSRFAVTIPNYLLNRATAPATNGSISAVVGAAFKSLAGIFMVTADMYSKHLPLAVPIGTQKLIDHADQNGLFEGRDGVCAGPPHLMSEILSAVSNGGRVDPGEYLAELVGDVDAFFRYAAGYTRLEFTKQLYAYEVENLIQSTVGLVSGYLDRDLEVDERTARLVAEVISESERERETPQRREQLHTDLCQELAALDWEREIDPDSLALVGTVSPSLLDRSVRLIPSGGSSEVDQEITEAIGSALIEGLAIDAAALERFTGIQREIDRAAGRKPAEHPLRLGDLERIGRTVSTLVRSWLSMDVEAGSDGLRVRGPSGPWVSLGIKTRP